MTATISHTRLRVLFAFFTVASLILSARLAYWQTAGRGELLGRATDQVRSDLAVAAQRGIIRDRSGAILATTVELRSLYAIPAQMKDPEGNDTRSMVAAARAKNGADAWLTVDLAVQNAAERELAAVVEREKATGGAIVVLDPKDGAVLAMASSPTYDPARVGSASAEALRNRGISWTYEPGSTLKAITIASAIDKGVVTPTTSYQDVGYAVIGGRTLCNAQCKVYGPTTVTQILARSQNAGAVFVASKLGAADLNAYLHAFGFGRPTGVDLAAETGGIVRPLAEWYPVDLGTISFGQGLSITPLQLASAYAAIANGGTLYRPYVVANRRGADGEHRTAPLAVRRVISEETAATMVTMLTTTVDSGIANAASLRGYSVAGKTGTAQIPSDDGRYIDDAYISSFAGFVPAIDPRMVVVVVLEKPQSKLLGTVPAMNTFKAIATDALRYARVQPDRP